MKCSIKRIDLFTNGELFGNDLPVDWQIEVSDSRSVCGLPAHKDIKFINGHKGCSYAAVVQRATSSGFPTVKSGFRIASSKGTLVAVLKTDSEVPT